jgi:hypothetical protein
MIFGGTSPESEHFLWWNLVSSAKERLGCEKDWAAAASRRCLVMSMSSFLGKIHA